MIRLFASFLITILIAGSAHAGDTAERRIIGFSPDGVWFAFEEFGISDGSGSPYANVYVINTDTDTWANGTPIRVNFGEKLGPISKARSKAMGRAIPILNRHGINEPGAILASRPATEITANPRRIDFYRAAAVKSPDRKVSYVLKEIDFKDSDECKTYGKDEKGFSLSYTIGGAPLVEVYRDKSVPKSRTCPTRYEISDVIEVARPGDTKQIKHVVMIHVYQMGFEGPNIRYIAVPVQLQLP